MNKVCVFFPALALLGGVVLAGIPSDSVKTKAPANWFNLDPTYDDVRGVGTERAYRELLKNVPSKTVIVGIIDSGIDINHEDLKGKIWTNPKEIPGNGIDDDKNGYIDDVNGWDFIGGKDGKDIDQEQLELTRLYVKYKKRFEGVDSTKLAGLTSGDKEDYARFEAIKEEFEGKAQESKMTYGVLQQMYESYVEADKLVKETLKTDKITAEDLLKIDMGTAEPKIKRARQVLDRGFKMGYDEKELKETLEHYQEESEFNLNPDFTPRAIVGDNPEENTNRFYGNGEVTGPDARHGTHVAGIIGANRSNTLGVKGVAENVKIMVIRAVPNGDERDKDVANAIRYAVDNGAKVVNMSFGKAYSPQKEWVDEAVRYAQSKGVLLIHAAGNEANNTDETPAYPTKTFVKDGKQADNWISVGALSWKKEPDAVATFSNYGKENVDLFAPGVDLYSTVPGSKYEELSGTSMASPVVTGVAALLLSHFPKLTAAQVKKILLESSVKMPELKVNKPGAPGEQVAFGDLSVTGGVVNAYNAVKMAQGMNKQ
ncbi:MAG: S8 family peptidase [Cytophagaceae bacterium]|nr:S8 family peptidase [Cytophagaceae bacterium]